MSQIHIIYKNVRAMLEVYRRYQLTDTALDDMSLISRIDARGYIILTGTRNADPILSDSSIVVILLSETSVLMSTSIPFKKLIDAQITDAVNRIVVIAPGIPSSHIQNKIIEFKQEHPDVAIEMLQHTGFVREVPKHTMVPKHEIISRDEVVAMLETFNTTVDFLPKIRQSDPMSVWLGAVPGNIIRVHRLSENAGITIAYLLCIL